MSDGQAHGQHFLRSAFGTVLMRVWSRHVLAAQRFKLRVPIRDMRLVDPNLLTSETGKILVRDNAIVFSIEHVRIIITGDQVRVKVRVRVRATIDSGLGLAAVVIY